MEPRLYLQGFTLYEINCSETQSRDIAKSNQWRVGTFWISSREACYVRRLDCVLSTLFVQKYMMIMKPLCSVA